MAKKISKTPEIRIANKSMKIKRQLIAIAKNYNMTYGEFWRNKIIQMIETYPEHMKVYIEDDGC